MSLWLRRLRVLTRSAAAFLRAPWRRKGLALEAAWELLRARIRTLGKASEYTRDLGAPDAPDRSESAPLERAALIGRVVAATARLMPFRALCLQQVIAVRRMLRRRQIPATVLLGLERRAGPGSDTGQERRAHAWVIAGGQVINGDFDLDTYVVVGRFN